jgi:hypothetical protein
VIVEREEMAQILRGELDEIVTKHEPPAIGSVQAVQAGVGKPARCYVLVTDSWPLQGGGYAVRFEMHHQEAQPRLLRRVGGYTTERSQALVDEPEAVAKDVQDRFSMEAGQGNAARVAEYERDQQQQSLATRLSILETLDAEGTIDLSRMLAPVRRQIEKAERKAFQLGGSGRAA